jgi:hypothetical protein
MPDEKSRAKVPEGETQPQETKNTIEPQKRPEQKEGDSAVRTRVEEGDVSERRPMTRDRRWLEYMRYRELEDRERLTQQLQELVSTITHASPLATREHLIDELLESLQVSPGAGRFAAEVISASENPYST